MSNKFFIWQICLLYRSQNLLVPCSPRSSVVPFSGPGLLLVVPHWHDIRHAAGLLVSREALWDNDPDIHSPYCQALHDCSAVGKNARRKSR